MNIYIIFFISSLIIAGILLAPLFVAKDITNRHKKLFSLSVISFLLGGSFLLYSHLGAPEIIPLLAKREERINELTKKITENFNELKQDPENIRAWLEIGDSFMETSQYPAATNAYKQAILLSQGNPAIIMAYARSIIIGANGTVTADAKKSLDMVLLLQPENEEVRYYQALYKLQSGNNKEAMEDMKNLYKSLPTDSPVKDMIDRQIGRK